LNKLAILAFALLLFFSTMLWYLANGSLNEYLKSQVELQGQYYSSQTTTLNSASFSANTGIANFNQIRLNNLNSYQAQHALVIDEVKAELSTNKRSPSLVIINKLSINKLTLNIEENTDKKINLEEMIQQITLTLANDYPEFYPSISAKLYAENNPELSAEKYAESHPQSGPIIEHTKQKKKRGKQQQKIAISAINIKNLELNTIKNGVINSTQKHDVNISSIGGSVGINKNQLGGEILLHLLSLAKQHQPHSS